MPRIMAVKLATAASFAVAAALKPNLALAPSPRLTARLRPPPSWLPPERSQLILGVETEVAIQRGEVRQDIVNRQQTGADQGWLPYVPVVGLEKTRFFTVLVCRPTQAGSQGFLRLPLAA